MNARRVLDVFHSGSIMFLAISAAAGAGSAIAQTTCTSLRTLSVTPSDAVAGNYVGNRTAVNADGSRVVVGSFAHGHGGISSGSVWVISDPGTAQQREIELLPSILQSGMQFCHSLAMNAVGDVLVVGAPWISQTSGQGDAFVFRFDGVAWTEEWRKTSVGEDYFGYSAGISASGEVFALGRPGYSPTLTLVNRGTVDVYRKVSTGWALESVPPPAEYITMGLAYSAFGNYMAMSANGETLAIGAGTHDGYSAQQNGAVFIYEYVGNAWVEIAKLQEPMAYSGGGFATALALDAAGTTLVVGNYQDSRSMHLGGAATIFHKGANGWAYDTVLLPSPSAQNGYFGKAVAINESADRILVGESGAPQGGALGAGAVNEFELTPSGWVRVVKHAPPNPTYGGFFGRSLAMSASGRRWIAGEPSADATATDSGVLHIFDAPCLSPTVYCTSQVNSLGCTAIISASGMPSCSSTSSFTIAADKVRNQQSGLLFYGTSGRNAQPLNGGTLCVQSPLRRLTFQNSSGSPAPFADCTGRFSCDFNAWARSGADPALFPGQHVRAQYYSRDPGATPKVNLTDAIEFYLEP